MGNAPNSGPMRASSPTGARCRGRLRHIVPNEKCNEQGIPRRRALNASPGGKLSAQLTDEERRDLKRSKHCREKGKFWNCTFYRKCNNNLQRFAVPLPPLAGHPLPGGGNGFCGDGNMQNGAYQVRYAPLGFMLIFSGPHPENRGAEGSCTAGSRPRGSAPNPAAYTRRCTERNRTRGWSWSCQKRFPA